METRRTGSGNDYITGLLNHRLRSFTPTQTTKAFCAQTTGLSERVRALKKVLNLNMQVCACVCVQSADTIIQHHIQLHFECGCALHWCDPDTLLDELNCVWPAKPLITMVESRAGELCVSVLFLNGTGLNKGPPTTTNTGSWGLSLTASFVFLELKKRSKSEDHLAENPSTQKCGNIHSNVTDRHCWCVFQILACQFEPNVT